ncbi:DivIVA domain-containing protein [Desulfosporosinus sp. PR]|uniref:DivIVA domain-containing protein n=1 Tax=Candidatus Desulfosporosinus nitrosoreducens TaxID=3401928 RepID=UPI0027E5F318|nr:DivIVA domain-containing protein [Desulfosporosinus sp. PR]MDQ7094946.1 DivIVA domain-containing protein [Desulfosporosinus sp. PR]
MPNFKRVIRGYEPEAVDQAWAEMDRQLSEANAANKELRLQINNLKEQNTERGNRLKDYEGIEKDLRDALLNAQRISTQMKEEAAKETEELIQSARAESKALIDEATQISESKEAEIELLLMDKKQKVIAVEEQIRELTSKKSDLQALVEQSIQHLDIVQRILRDSPTLIVEPLEGLEKGNFSNDNFSFTKNHENLEHDQ